MSMNRKVTAIAHPNLALVKYWGKADERLNIPANSSISVNLGSATTITSVVFSPDQDSDIVAINGHNVDQGAYRRVVRHIDRIRAMAGISARANVESSNDFPASAGIASSASAFAALSLAATRAAGLNPGERALSILARKGSGSACRSIPDGFVEWSAGTDDESSYAYQLAPANHWDIAITSVIIDAQPKDISSSEGHHLAKTSPFYRTRLTQLPRTLETVRQALLNKDFGAFGQAVEREAVSMHTIAMTAHSEQDAWLSGIYYWQPATMGLIQVVQRWRRDGLEVYFTIDAGPNVHLLCEAQNQKDLEEALAKELASIGGRFIVSKPADGARVVEESSI